MISVIVPVYNVEKYLEACVCSILAQTYRDLEVILVNDGSRDSSLAICNRLAMEDTRIRVLDGPNGGVGHARNRGLDAARGEYVSFVDSDDTIVPDMYEVMLTALQHADADMAECGLIYVREDGTVERNRSLGTALAETPEECLRKFAFLENTDTGPCTKLYKRSIIGDIRFPHYAQGEDAYFNLQVILRCSRKVTIPDCLYYYLQRGTSSTHKTAVGKELDEAEVWMLMCQKLEEISPALCPLFRKKTVDIIMMHLNESLHGKPPHWRRICRTLKKWYISCYPKQFDLGRPMTGRQKLGFLLFSFSPRLYFWYNQHGK